MTQDKFEELKTEADTYWETRSNGNIPLIRIGTAMCGHAAGAYRVADKLKTVLSERSIEANFDEVGCLGLCYAEPLLDIKKPGSPRVFFNNVTADDIDQIIEGYLINNVLPESNVLGYMGEGEVPESAEAMGNIPGIALQNRIALRNAGHIAPSNALQYIATGGYSGLYKAVTTMEPSEVIDEVKNSGLRGRGGAAFPTGVKWSFLVGSPGPTKYILCNCEEGDPGAYNDKGILESDPHTLLEGLAIA